MQCFNNGKPNLTPKDVILNKKSKTIYNYLTQLVEFNEHQNHNGTTTMDCSGFLHHTGSFEMLQNIQYGHALCAPCDTSLCDCSAQIDVSSEFVFTNPVLWDILQKADSWNAENVIVDTSGTTYFTLCGPSGSTDISANFLEPSGGSLDGSGVCMNSTDDLFGNCSNLYFPEGKWAAFSPKDLEMVNAGKKPETTQDNYLGNMDGFKYPSRIRFHR